MKKFISVLLSVVAICLSICSIMLSIKTLEAVESLRADESKEVTEAVDEAITEIENSSEETNFTDEQMEKINQAIADFFASKESEETETIESTETTENAENTENVAETTQEEVDYSFTLTDEERAERLAKQAEIQAAREYLYTQPASVEKTEELNQLDEQMIANNTIDFTKKTITFLGDSVTEGIGSSVDADGNYTGYVTYIDSYFHFGKLLNNGNGGWMYGKYNGDEYSIVANMSEKIYIDSDILVFYYGINDLISDYESKRMGTYSSSTTSTAGFCGDVETLCTFLTNYFSDRDIFFVLTYPITRQAGGTYEIESEPHELGDYMDAIKTIATRHGFNIIDLYSIGLLDESNADLQSTYLSDDIHPNDAGHKLIGEHIAAEISYVLGQK